jgi:hypothetical protein
MAVIFVIFSVFLGLMAFGHWEVAGTLAVLGIFIAFIIWMRGGFQPCPRCGSCWTVQLHDETPDASRGSGHMHPWTAQKCWNPRCRKTTVLEGITVVCKDENGRISD